MLTLAWWGWLACTPADPATPMPTGSDTGSEATGDTASVTIPTVPSGTPTPEPSTPGTTPPPCEDPPEVLTFTEPGARWDRGDPATMVHGPQGGWHIGSTAKVHGPRDLDATFGVDWIDAGVQLAGDDNTFRLRLTSYDEAACEGTLYGGLAYLDDPGGVDQAYICALEGERLLVWMELVDPLSGRADRVEVEVIAALDPADDCSAYAAAR